MITRREAFAAAAAAPLLAATTARADAKGDGDLLDDGVRLEQLSAYVFRMDGAPEELLALAPHEDEHADALATALDALGRKRPPAPKDEKAFHAEMDYFGIPGAPPDTPAGEALLQIALAVEERTLAHHHDSIGRFKESRILQMVATIMAAQGQHLVVIRKALGRDPLPEPVVTGRA